MTVVLASLLTGCATQKQTSASVSNLVIAEPLPINPQSEIALARLSEIIARVEITDEQGAKLFYDRGVIYDSVGLRGLAHFDFQRALRLKPDLVDAYNFIGIHATQRQDFLQAYEAFDSALELEPNHEFAYLNRGLALYYGGRPGLASEDIRVFYSQDDIDPYRIIWVYLVEREIDPVAASAYLKSSLQGLQHDDWAKNILRLFANEINELDFVSTLTVGVKSQRELTNRLCEAYFYLGKYHLLQGKQQTATNYFKLALSTNVYEFIEHRYAKLELDLLHTLKAPTSIEK